MHYQENWLREIDPNDVIEVLVETGGVSIAPDSKTVINKTTDKEEISRLLSEWNEVILEPIYDDSEIAPGGKYEYIMFKLKDGTFYTIYSENKVYNNGSLNLKLSHFPNIDEDKITSTEEGVVDKFANMDFIVLNIEDVS